MKIVDYSAYHGTLFSVTKYIKESLEAGWLLHGDTKMASLPNGIVVYFQAFIKVEEEDEV